MISFQAYIQEKAGGAKPGSLEIEKLSLQDARKYANREFLKRGRVFEEELPNHDQNFQIAKQRASMGHTKRKDMPVISPKDIKVLQKALMSGTIDLQSPWSDDTDASDPFPEGLSGKEAENFFNRGLRIHDGSKPDDKVSFKKMKVPVRKLVPIQEQIYYDKSIPMLATFGAKASRKFHQSTIFLTSSDFRIIDGHHRFLSAILVDPDVKVNAFMVDLPIEKLLPLTLAFGDALGNKRNL